MTFVLKDRVRDTTTTTGTGALTLSGTAPSGSQTFGSVMSVGDTCWYAIVLAGAEWEAGIGTYSGTNTLTRTTVLESSNTNAAVSFSAGTKDVFIDFPASKAASLFDTAGVRLGETDSERQNVALDRIYASKGLGDIRRQVKEVATGFKASTDTLRGINAGSSSNYDTTNAAASGYIVNAQTATVNGNFAQANNSAISFVVGGSAQYQGFKWTASATSTLSTVVVNVATLATSGNAIAKLYTNNAGSPGTQIGSSSGTVNITSTGDKTFTFASPPSVTASTVYWIVLDCAGGTLSSTLTTATTISGYDSGRAVTITSITGNNYGSALTLKMQINYVVIVNSMTLVGSTQTASATSGNGRILIEFDNTAAPTLNTDLNALVSCDGANFSAATLSSAGTGQSGRSVAESDDVSCGANTGTSVIWKITTANSKSVPIYGVSHTWH